MPQRGSPREARAGIYDNVAVALHWLTALERVPPEKPATRAKTVSF